MQILTAYNPGFLQVPYLFVIRLPLGKNSVSLIWTRGTEHGEQLERNPEDWGDTMNSDFPLSEGIHERNQVYIRTNVDQGQK